MARTWPWLTQTSSILLRRVFVGLCLCGGIATCMPLLNTATPPTIEKRADLPQCRIEGNADFYGLGIRVGIYLQWITAFLANHILRKAIHSNLETNTIFLVALFVATAVASGQQTVQTAELVVLLHLCFGFLFSILSIWGHRTGNIGDNSKKVRFPLIGSFFRLTLATSLTAYSVWFWFQGQYLHSRPEECTDYTFMFAKVDVAGGIRYFFEVQSTIILAIYTILFGREFLMIISFFIFVCIQTTIIAGLATWFGSAEIIANRDEKRVAQGELKRIDTANSRQSSGGREASRAGADVWFLIKQWISLSMAMAWKQLNGKDSAGSKRPDLRYYLIPFIDLWIFFNRSVIQFCCLLFFKWTPKMDFIPMIPHPIYMIGRRVIRPKTKWDLFVKRMEKFNTRQAEEDSDHGDDAPEQKNEAKASRFEELIYTANAICIIWAITSVELTIYWNQIDGVYSLSSTGQLIPFVIGVVGLIGLLHGHSVERSKLNSTDVLLSLLDADMFSDNASIKTLDWRGKDDPDTVDKYSINGRQQAVFWIRKPTKNQRDEECQGSFYKRRHSFSILDPGLYNCDNADGSDNSTDLQKGYRSDQSHLSRRFVYRELREVYHKENIEVYPYVDKDSGREYNVYIVKDFRDWHSNVSYTTNSRGRSRSRTRSLSRSRSLSRTRSRSRSRSRSRTRSRHSSQIGRRSLSSSTGSRRSGRSSPSPRRRKLRRTSDDHGDECGNRRCNRSTRRSSSMPGRSTSQRRSRSASQSDRGIPDSRSASRSRPRARRLTSRRQADKGTEEFDSETGANGNTQSEKHATSSLRRSRSRSRYSANSYSADSYSSDVESGARNQRFRAFGRLKKVWRKSKILAVIMIIAFFGCVVPLAIMYRLFKKPLGAAYKFALRKWSGRIKWAATTFLAKFVAHVKESFRRETKSAKDNTADKPESEGNTKASRKKRGKVKRKSPHIQSKRPVTSRQLNQLHAAFSTRSFATMLHTCSAVADEILCKHGMTQTAEWVKQLNAFMDEAKSVRRRRLKGQIGRALQHEILADYYLNYVRQGMVAVITKEIEAAVKRGKKGEEGEATRESAGGGEERKTADSVGAESSHAEDAEDADGDFGPHTLERWFSWAGSGSYLQS